MAAYGHDPRRYLTTEEKRLLYIRADGLCQDCGAELDSSWHSAHMAAYAGGGATDVDEMRAQCASCNLSLGARDMEQVEGLSLRQWQQLALPVILERLWQHGSATLHAAPGAGKTLFAAAVFRHLADRGLVSRLVVFVPNANLVSQTVEAYKKVRIHLDGKPRDGFIEHPETVGLVVCYQSLSEGAAEAHALRMVREPTMVVFDEVHHLAEQEHSAWGRYVGSMVGEVASGPPENAAAVLNMTGTLFRSAASQRIATVRYRKLPGNKLEAVPDWSITTAELIGVELRAPDLYAYGGKATLIDLENEKVIESEVVDLGQQQRSAVNREAFRSRQWLGSFCSEGLRLLNSQLVTVGREVPLKLLHVADDQDTAKLAADIYNELAGHDIAVLVISDEPGSAKKLKQVRKDLRPRVIVTCQMVTEGFDCHELSVLVHATRKAARLFVAQVMARVMRVTDYERAARRLLPAQILIPDDRVLRGVYAAAIKSGPHIVEEEEEAGGRCHAGHRRRMCPCQYPGDSECTCPWVTGPGPLRKYDLISLEDPRLDMATVLGHDDGDVSAAELEFFIQQCLGLGIPEPYAPRVAVAVRRGAPAQRKYSGEKTAGVTATEAPASPREVVDAYRARLKLAAGFMEKHIRHDASFRGVAEFQGRANDAGEIPAGGRDLATARQLAAASRWACGCVRRHCHAHGEQAPEWANGVGDG
jgi:superfamily II DNA or RNA helicase